MPIFISIGILIFFLQTLEFSSYPSKQWNSGPFPLSFRIMILFVQTLEFWPYFIHTGILTSSFETMEFWPYSYKHLPLILSFHCNNWNSCPILPNINLNSAPVFYSHWNFDVILPNTAILALSVYTLKFLSYRSRPWNSGPIFMHIYTLAFWPHRWKHCNSGPILLHIGIWISSSQTLDF